MKGGINMSEVNNTIIVNQDKKHTTIKASIIVVIISFLLSIVDMGLISSCDYEMAGLMEGVVAFLLEGICSVIFLVGIIVSSIYVAKKKIGPSILVVNIVLFVIWAFTAFNSFYSIICIVGPWSGDDPDAHYYIDVSQYHFNFLWYEHYYADVDSRTLIRSVGYDYYFPYILFVGNLILTAVVMPLYVKENAKHKSEKISE